MTEYSQDYTPNNSKIDIIFKSDNPYTEPSSLNTSDKTEVIEDTFTDKNGIINQRQKNHKNPITWKSNNTLKNIRWFKENRN